MQKISLLISTLLIGVGMFFGVNLNTEFIVNSTTFGDQTQPAVGMDSAGNFIATWTSEVEWDIQNKWEISEIFAQVFNSEGNPIGPGFQVNSDWDHIQFNPKIAVGPDGNFIITWVHYEANSAEIYAKMYDTNTIPLGEEFQVNDYSTGLQGNPDIALDSEGNFVITWQSWDQDTSGLGIFAKKFGPQGIPLVPEFQVNTTFLNDQFHPAIAINSQNKFIIVWTSFEQDGHQTGLYAQQFEIDGSTIGPEFRVDFPSIGWQDWVDVAIDSSDNYLFCWHRHQYDENAYDIFARKMDPSLTILIPEFKVNLTTQDWQVFPRIDTDGNGSFIVVWESQEQDGNSSSIFAQIFDSQGNILEQEFQVSDPSQGRREAPEVKMISRQKYLSIWQATQPSSSKRDIYAKIFTKNIETLQTSPAIQIRKKHAIQK
ncbi:MAG: hypothetical protein MUP98_13430 [Candidatus Aminicenantes bacterium]|nr:hypothetical protein [Candidatus Aminicenantes bacterium]